MMFPWTEHESALKKVTTIILNLSENCPVSAQQMLIASRETSQLRVPSLNKSLCFSPVRLQSEPHTFKQNSFAEDLSSGTTLNVSGQGPVSQKYAVSHSPSHTFFLLELGAAVIYTNYFA